MPVEPKQSEFLLLDLAEVSELLRSKKLSPLELTRASLITVTAEMALGQEGAPEAELQNRCTAFVTNAANMILISGTVSYPAQPLPH